MGRSPVVLRISVMFGLFISEKICSAMVLLSVSYDSGVGWIVSMFGLKVMTGRGTMG